MDPSAGVTTPPRATVPLEATLARFAGDSFEPCLADPIQEIITRYALSDFELIFGIAAESAGKYSAELREFPTLTELSLDFDRISDAMRIF